MRGRNLMATRLFRQCSFLSVRSESNHIDRSLASRVFPLDKWQQDCSCSLWLWSSSRSSSLLLPGLEKLPTLGGDRIWNLKDLESCKWIVGRGGRRGGIVRLSTTTLIERPSVNPLLPVIYKTWNISPFYIHSSCSQETTIGRIRAHSELDDAGNIYVQ